MRSARTNGAVLKVGPSSGMHTEQHIPLDPSLRRAAGMVFHEKTLRKPRQFGAKRTFTAEQVRALRRLHVSHGICAADLALIAGIEIISMVRVLDGTNYSKVL